MTKRINKIPESVVAESRKLFTNSTMTVRQICEHFGYNLRGVLYNKSHKDDSYIVPKKKLGRRMGR